MKAAEQPTPSPPESPVLDFPSPEPQESISLGKSSTALTTSTAEQTVGALTASTFMTTSGNSFVPGRQSAKLSQASFRDLFHFFQFQDKLLLGLAIVVTIVQGFGTPLYCYIFGEIVSVFSGTNLEEMEKQVQDRFILMLIMASGVLVLATVSSFLWNVIAGKQATEIKMVYFRRLLFQNTTWYDQQKGGEVASNFVDQISSLMSVFSNKLQMFFLSLSAFGGSIIIAFVKGWFFSILIMALFPFLGLAAGFFVWTVSAAGKASTSSYAEAGAVADESITFIKTVKSLNGEEHEIQRYLDAIEKNKRQSTRFGILNASGWALLWGIMVLVYGMICLIGTRLISDRRFNDNWGREYNVGDILCIFMAILMGFQSLEQLTPALKAISAGRVAVAAMFRVIKDEQTEKSGILIPDKILGEFSFEDVSFAYPTSPDTPVIKNLTMKIQAGQKVALVGPSGCGKSTLVGLMMRYYDPTGGRILLDGVDLKWYDLKTLRSRFGVVSQQPILFAESVRFNVCLGSQVSEKDDEAIWAALEQAEARTFVESLPLKLDEFVGSLGGQLSGGQKQRLAIARALIRKPDVFLFDEATSALDRTNEAGIQKTLDEASRHTTSISVAHRLSTIKNSDAIFVFSEGALVETGTHDQLMSIDAGVYKGLVAHQLEEIKSQEDIDVPEADQPLVFPGALAKDELTLSPSESSGAKSPTLDQVPGGELALEIQPVPIPAAPANNPKKGNKSIFSMMGKERSLLPVAIVCAALGGAMMPIFGFLMGSIIDLMVKLTCLSNLIGVSNAAELCKTTDTGDIIRESNLIILGFGMLSLTTMIVTFAQLATCAVLAERFTYNLRQGYFRRLMYMDLSFFDRPQNQPAAVTARLAVKCKKVNSLVGLYLGILTMALFELVVGIIIAFVFSWAVALVALGMTPFLLAAAWIMSKYKVGSVESKNDTGLDGSDLLSESINNMRVVRSLTAEEAILGRFIQYDAEYKRKLIRRSILTGVYFGLSQFMLFMVFASIFRVSMALIIAGQIDATAMFKSLYALLIGVFGAGMNSQFLADYQETFQAAKEIMSDVNVVNKIEVDPQAPANTATEVEPALTTPIEGLIEFKRVSFQYEGRDQKILDRLNLKIAKGQSVALVGPSGCGKSTVMQLLLRYYDPTDGQILLDGVDIREYNLAHLRRAFGVVRQEPALFNGSVRYNLAYSNPGLTDEELWSAAELANATNFIRDAPDGLDRDVGNRGERLSGGQRQRLAIARVVASKPLIYLFDEATSALDTKSEQVVQEAIDKLSQKATSITVAHRLSTIKKCDPIFVLDSGRVIEKGTYDQLLTRGGRFCHMASN